MKTIVLTSAIASVLFAASAGAVDLSTTHTTGTTTTTVNVDQHVTGTTNGLEFNYSQNRGGAMDGVNNQCGDIACQGTGNDTLNVGVSLDVTQRIGRIDQLTTGVTTTRIENCDVTVAIGGLSNSQGYRMGSTHGETTTQNHNTVDIKTVKIDIATQTDLGYTGSNGSSKPGNDFTANINGIDVNSEGTSLPVMILADRMLDNPNAITINGQDLNKADVNGMSIKVDVSDLNVYDQGRSTTVTDTEFSTWYENN
ncbi:hypothetical protein CZP2022_137 [Vibrio phage C-ZP2022]|nr:hypothetical protein CZP2022_137 [Vibrio phage C-ZP2022]